MKYIWLIILFFSSAAYACGTRCYPPHKNVFSGTIVKAKVIKANNPPSNSYDFLCHVSIKQPHFWKGSSNSNIVVLNGHWEDCKTRYKVGEEALFLANSPDGEKWMEAIAKGTSYFYRPWTFIGENRKQRVEYLKTASVEDLANETIYCNNMIDPR